MGEKLRPLKCCPFCGGEPVADVDDSTAFIICSSCGAKGPESLFRATHKEEQHECCANVSDAINEACDYWNNRYFESEKELIESCFKEKQIKPLKSKIN